MELKIILGILWRRKWVFIGIFLLILLTAIIVTALRPNIYKSSAKILINESQGELSFLSEMGMEDISHLNKMTEIDLESHIVIMTSKPVISKVISKLQLRNNQGNLYKENKILESPFIISKIFPRPHLEVSETGDDTNILEISSTASEPFTSAYLANTLIDIYVKRNIQQRRAEFHDVSEFLDHQIKKVKSRFDQLLKEKEAFQIQNQILDVDKQISKLLDRQWSLYEQKQNLIQEIVEIRTKIKALKKDIQAEGPEKASMKALEENPRIRELKKDLTELFLQRIELSTEKRSSHPEIKALKHKIEQIKQELKQEVSLYEQTSTELQNLKLQLTAYQSGLQEIKAQIDSFSKRLAEMPEKISMSSELKMKYDLVRERYSNMLEYKYLLGMVKSMIISSVQVISRAQIPDWDDPEEPSQAMSTILSLFLGLFLATFTALLVDYVDDSIKNPEELKNKGLNYLGSVQKFKKGDKNLIKSINPKDPVCEAYRTIRNSLKYFLLDKPLRALAMTSSRQGEGKTLSSINLGISFTRENKRVLLIDTDLRNPQLKSYFDLDGQKGLTTFITGECSLKETIFPTDVEGLFVMSSGPVPPDPGKLLESEQMQNILLELQQDYDLIIMDLPPVFVAQDAIVMGQKADMLIYIVEAGNINEKGLDQALELIKQARLENTGFVLNKYKPGRERYHYYYHKYGYSYKS